MAKCFKNNTGTDRTVEAYKFVDWNEKDPISFVRSRLSKYEKVKITTDLTNSVANAYIHTCASDKSVISFIKNNMTAISEKEYNDIAEAARTIIKASSDIIRKIGQITDSVSNSDQEA